MTLEFCRDCANFEDRRDIDNSALCRKRQGPFLCCEDFEPIGEDLCENKLYHRFCKECTNFEDVNGVSLCAMNHTPGVACREFTDRFEKLKATRQNSHMKTALIVYAIGSRSDPDLIPYSIIEIGRKIRW